MGKIPKNHQNTPRQIFNAVARLLFELFFPAIEIYVNIRRAFRGSPAEFSEVFYGTAVHFRPDGLAPPVREDEVSVPEALKELKGLLACGELGLRELNQHRRLRTAEVKALIQRILMGLFGGIALICPVLIMALSPSRNTNLITVSLATIVFAILLAIGASDSTGKDVLAATAAYTAVLVVFFGTSSS